MTKTEFKTAYKAAQESIRKLSIQMTKKIKAIYAEAAREIAETIANTSEGMTQDHLMRIEQTLQRAAENISDDLDKTIRKSMSDAVDENGKPIQKVIDDAIKAAGVDGLDADVIAKMVSSVNERVVANTINRIFADGYSYSSRIWKAGVSYQNNIKNIVAIGQALGRSTIDIAKDIQTFTKKGKIQLATRYGPNLVKGDVDSFRKGKAQRIDWKAFEAKYGPEATKQSRDFMKRIGINSDYRALRLARTEYQMSLKEASVQQAAQNPATTGEFDWVPMAGACEICTEIADGSPYTEDEINDILAEIHPNDMCKVIPRLRNERDFQRDLKDWANGKDVPYINDWYNNKYRASA